MTLDVFGTVMSCAQLASQAKALCELCQGRGKKFETFGRTMLRIHDVLNGLGPALPLTARPLARDIELELAQAREKIDKYIKRGTVSAAYHAHQEDEKLRNINSRLQMLLIMLIAACSGSEQLEDLKAQLVEQIAEHQNSAKEEMCAVRAQLQILHDTVAAALQGETAAAANEVQRKLEELKHGQLTHNARVVQLLAGACSDLQSSLALAVETIKEPLMQLQRSQDAWMAELRHTVAREARELKAHMRQVGNDIKSEVGTHLEALQQQMKEEHKQTQDVVTQHMDMHFKGLVTCIVERVYKKLRGSEQDVHAMDIYLRCPVKEFPYTRSGPGMPVRLPSCGCTMSFAAAKLAERSTQCPCCLKPKEASAVDYAIDDSMLHLVMMDRCGDEVPQLEERDITLGDVVGRGAEGTVHRATYKGQPVAVKALNVQAEGRKVVDTLVWTMVLASSCEQVCTLYGVCWVQQGSVAWLVMELCVTSLETAVSKGSPKGWPVADVVVLGLELLEALRAVHTRARALHLDVKPANVLITPRKTAVLADFGICEHVPPRLTRKTLQNVQPGTAAYAAPEQFSVQQATHASDIYGLGATMLFAACGSNPWFDYTDWQVLGMMKDQKRLPVPEFRDAPGLRELLQDMTSPDRHRRPEVSAVRSRLQALQTGVPGTPTHISCCWEQVAAAEHSRAWNPDATTPAPQLQPPPTPLRSSMAESAVAGRARNPDATSPAPQLQPPPTPLRSSMAERVEAGRLGTLTDLCSAVNTHGSTALEVDLDGKTLQPGPQVQALARTIKKYTITKTKEVDAFACSVIDGESRNTWVFSCKRSVNVKCGTLDLPEGGTLVFDQSCTSVTLCDLTVKGGLLVFQGKGCKVELKNTTLIRCGILVANGARLTLSDNCSSGRGSGLALLVAGPGTTADVSATVFTSHEQACLAEKGAQMRMDHVTVEAAKMCGVEARHDKTSMTLEECTVVTANTDVQKDHVRALHVTAGASATATACQLSGGGVGVDAVGPGSKLRLASCTVSNNKADGVRVRTKASADLAECKITDNLEDGVWIKGEGTWLVGKMCDSDGNKLNGFSAQEGAEMVLEQCGANGNSAAGFSQRKDAKLRANACTATSNKDGFESAMSSTATLEGCTAEENQEAGYTCTLAGKLIMKGCKGNKNSLCGVHAQERADIDLDGCTCSGNSKVGVGVIGAGTKARAVNCVCEDHTEFGVLAAEGAVVTLQGCKLNRNNKGVSTMGEKAMLSATQCTAEGNSRGFDTAHGSSAKLVRCTGNDNSECGFCVFNPGTKLIASSCTAKKNELSGFLIAKGAVATLEGCTSVNQVRSGYTCYDADSTLEAKGCTGEGNQDGAYLSTGSQSKLTDCSFTNNTEAGVAAFSPGTKTVITRCTAKSNRMSGVHAQDSAAVELDKCELTDNMMAGIRVRGSAVMRASHCNAERNKEEGFDVSHGAQAKLHGCNARNNVHGISCSYPGTEVAAVRCVTENNETTGFKASVGGRMQLEDCKSMGNTDGIFVSMEGSKVDARRCSITRNKDQGVWAQRDAVAELFQCTLVDNANGRFQTVSGGRVDVR